MTTFGILRPSASPLTSDPPRARLISQTPWFLINGIKSVVTKLVRRKGSRLLYSCGSFSSDQVSLFSDLGGQGMTLQSRSCCPVIRRCFETVEEFHDSKSSFDLWPTCAYLVLQLQLLYCRRFYEWVYCILSRQTCDYHPGSSRLRLTGRGPTFSCQAPPQRDVGLAFIY